MFQSFYVHIFIVCRKCFFGPPGCQDESGWHQSLYSTLWQVPEDWIYPQPRKYLCWASRRSRWCWSVQGMYVLEHHYVNHPFSMFRVESSFTTQRFWMEHFSTLSILSGPNFMALLTAQIFAYDHHSPLTVQVPNLFASWPSAFNKC